jgi:hypothetical protein
MPRVTVSLMRAEARDNDPFYLRAVDDYFGWTCRRHRKFPVLRNDRFGVALLRLPASPEAYFSAIEGSARRNVRKARRGRYVFERIDFNAHLDGVKAIWQSAPIRQGPVPGFIRSGDVRPASNPPTRTVVHDYAYFGVFSGDTLVAYAACFVAGQACLIEQIFGHADYQRDGVTPLLIVSLIEYVMKHYPAVRYVTYDNFLGAGNSLRRFKRKFGFEACRVRWTL